MEKFDSQFHKRYVGGEGEIDEKSLLEFSGVIGMSYEEVLDEYRRYMRDPHAELPEVIISQLKMSGKVST